MNTFIAKKTGSNKMKQKSPSLFFRTQDDNNRAHHRDKTKQNPKFKSVSMSHLANTPYQYQPSSFCLKLTHQQPSTRIRAVLRIYNNGVPNTPWNGAVRSIELSLSVSMPCHQWPYYLLLHLFLELHSRRDRRSSGDCKKRPLGSGNISIWKSRRRSLPTNI